MKVDIWMPIYINDYLADTMRLDAEKHGVYLLLMMDYWKHKELPSDTFELSMIARVAEDNKSLLYVLKNFFTLEGGKYTHKRIEKELQAASARRESARENGKKGGRPRNNPETTHGFNEGKPTENREGNPNHNPQKSSSSSSSSSHTSTALPTNTKKGEKAQKRFSPPSCQDVMDYTIEKGYKIDPQRFINYYESKGWLVGKVKMKSWKAAVSNWATNDYSDQKKYAAAEIIDEELMPWK